MIRFQAAGKTKPSPFPDPHLRRQRGYNKPDYLVTHILTLRLYGQDGPQGCAGVLLHRTGSCSSMNSVGLHYTTLFVPKK